jgi:hypothetical protein
MSNQPRKAYTTPRLTIHGTIEEITQQRPLERLPLPGKGPAALDGTQAQPNSKTPSGTDGQGGAEVS